MSTTEATIGEIVTADYRAAGILDAYGIDFCYWSKKTLQEVSEAQHLNKATIEQALAKLTTQPNGSSVHWNFSEWDTRFLVEYIVHTHHAHAREALPKLLELGARVSASAAEKYPETMAIYQALLDLNGFAKHHLTSEEYALFPYILEMENVRDSRLPFVAPEFGRVETPIHAIEDEHLACIALLHKIRELSGHFSAAVAASPEHRSWYSMLKEFDADMHLHVHLENNILFPRAIALEAELLTQKGFTSIWFG